VQSTGEKVLAEVAAGQIEAALGVIGFLVGRSSSAVNQRHRRADCRQPTSEIVKRNDGGVLHLAL